jgi:hypothetical protein
MRFSELRVELPEKLVLDFASDPLAPFDKLLKKASDSAWPLYPDLSRCLASLHTNDIEIAYADNTFIGLYGKNERLARIWIVDRLLVEEAARRRLTILAAPAPAAETPPYTAESLRRMKVDGEGMVRIADFGFNDATLSTDEFSFTVCSTTECPNSTYWLLRSFYNQGIADHVSVRLDPFLWGRSDSFPQTMYKMIVYAKPVNWEGIGKLKEIHHGQMRTDNRHENGELTEFLWEPRNDGIHFVCEELPSDRSVEYRAARYLHAIYDPEKSTIVHFDGALRIYSMAQLEERRKLHLRHAGKAGIRTKVFRIDQPLDRNAFSLIAQAFFVWNRDLVAYFGKTLTA